MATEDHRRKIHTTSPSPISKLGDGDLLAEVIIRLPDPKSTFRCKAVCKPWKSLLCTPEFTRRLVTHRRIASAVETEPPLLFVSAAQGPIFSFLPKTTSPRYILDCFRDLLLLVTEDKLQGGEECGRSFLVCNPFTKQWLTIPLAPQVPKFVSWTARLVCQPCHSITLDLGDGGAEEEEDDAIITHHTDYWFSVVRMYELGSQISTAIDVFCSRSGEWTELDAPDDISPHWNLHNVAVSLNGKLYWENGLGDVAEWDPNSVLYNDGCGLLLAPGFMLGSGLWVSQGTLHAIFLLEDELSVWRVGEGEEEEEEDDEDDDDDDGAWAWATLYEVSMEKLMCGCGTIVDERGHEIACSDLEIFIVVGQHIEKPEIVFFGCSIPGRRRGLAIVSCDLETQKAEFLAYLIDSGEQQQRVFQPRIDLWPTPLPR